MRGQQAGQLRGEVRRRRVHVAGELVGGGDALGQHLRCPRRLRGGVQRAAVGVAVGGRRDCEAQVRRRRGLRGVGTGGVGTAATTARGDAAEEGERGGEGDNGPEFVLHSRILPYRFVRPGQVFVPRE